MCVFAFSPVQAMSDIGTSLDLAPQAVEHYTATAASLADMQLLQQMHYDAGKGYFADWGLHTEQVQLART